MKKRCSKCNENLLESEFYKDPRASTGLYSRCKKCHAAKTKVYYYDHLEYYREHARRYAPKRAARMKERRLQTPGLYSDNVRRCRARHPEEARRQDSMYKRLRRIPGLRAFIFERDGYACRSCNATSRLCIDHIKPVSRGGENSPKNLQVLCRTCNGRKRTAEIP